MQEHGLVNWLNASISACLRVLCVSAFNPLNFRLHCSAERRARRNAPYLSAAGISETVYKTSCINGLRRILSPKARSVRS